MAIFMMCWPHVSGSYLCKRQQRKSVGYAYMSVKERDGSMENLFKWKIKTITKTCVITSSFEWTGPNQFSQPHGHSPWTGTQGGWIEELSRTA